MEKNRIYFDKLLRKKRKQSKIIAFCSVLSALGVVILYLGAILEVLDISCAALASMLCIIVYAEIGGVYPWLVYGVTGALSLLLLPSKFGAVMYVCLAGFYPMLKVLFERFVSRFLEWLCKIILFNIAMTAMIIIATFVFSVADMGRMYILTLYVVGNVTFVIYDIALGMLIRLYYLKFRRQLQIDRILK